MSQCFRNKLCGCPAILCNGRPAMASNIAGNLFFYAYNRRNTTDILIHLFNQLLYLSVLFFFAGIIFQYWKYVRIITHRFIPVPVNNFTHGTGQWYMNFILICFFIFSFLPDKLNFIVYYVRIF